MKLFERLDNYSAPLCERGICNFVGTALAIGLGVAAAGSVASSAIGAHAAGKAADVQASAADRAAALQHQDAQDSLAFQKDQWNTQQANTKPWIDAGHDALGTIRSDMADGTYHDWTGSFTAPTDVTEQNDPGYKFRLAEGMKALEKTAASRGSLLTGGTAKAEGQFAQDYASNEYNNVYNRSFGEYLQNYNQFNTNQSTRFNRYAAISGLGQTTNAQQGQLGQQVAGNVSTIYATDAKNQGEQINNAAAARASGYVGAGNAWSSGISNISNLALIAAMKGKGGGSGTSPLPFYMPSE